MRRRFGRGRRTSRSSGESARSAPIDAGRILERVSESGILGEGSLSPVDDDEIPDHYAVLFAGEGEGGRRRVVAYAPRHGGDAALAVLSLGLRLARDDDFAGDVVAVAPQWDVAARRRLSLLAGGSSALRAVAASALSDNGAEVVPEPAAPDVVPARAGSALLEREADRSLYLRALSTFEGLAAKHGGVVRGAGGTAELVLLARRAAVLRPEPEGVVLESLAGERSRARLAADDLATAMDRLEGLLRKQLNDRRVRAGEEGLRASLLSNLVEAEALRDVTPWPLGGSDPEVLDLAGLTADGRPVMGAVRERLTLPALGAILDAALALRPALPGLLGGPVSAFQPATPRLVVAAKDYDDAALRVISALGWECAVYDVVSRRGRAPAVSLRESGAAPSASLRAPAATPAASPRERERAPAQTRAAPEPASEGAEARRSRGRRAGGEKRSGYDEVSLFDLDDDRRNGDGAEDASARRGRRGRRRRGRRGRSEGAAAAPDDGDAREEDTPPPPRRGRGRGQRRPTEENGGDRVAAVEEEEETLVPLAEDAPDPDAPGTEPAYDDEEVADEEAPDDRLVRVREAQRQARTAKSEAEAELEEAPRLPRRRAAVLAHADRDSVMSAVLLARDLRLLEGIWVYPQSELMTFFRGVATDMRDDTPIYVVGFTASPARETLQAASLYRGRLAWFDHHDWPPEDLEALRSAVGAEFVHVTPGSESCLSAVLRQRTRRSRFSDKLVELLTGRFTHHDYERWGRVWWHRLGEIAGRTGDRKNDLAPLLTGRPSDLAKEAAASGSPPLPREVEHVSSRDFRLVHFGGYGLAVVPVPAELDLHLTARIARERYAAQLSVAFPEGGELVVLGGDEGRGRRGLDLSGMVDHLASKHRWVEVLPSEDFVARMRVRDLTTRPERLDELVAEIAMGRSLLEG